MFREIDPEPEFHGPEEEDTKRCGDPRLLGPGSEVDAEYEQYLQEASKHKVRYEFELEGLLRRSVFAFYGVNSAL